MCGRYSLICTDELGNRFRVPLADPPCRPRFNVAPSQVMPIVVNHDQFDIVPMEWGLVPHWAREPTQYRRPINARAETLADRPMFRGLLRNRRCLVPASGFYEWKKDGGQKAPYYIRVRETSLFAFAGLFDLWTDPAGVEHSTYTIITTAANDLVQPIHDRMPAILSPEMEERWLDPAPMTSDELSHLLCPYPPGAMEAYPISRRVNSLTQDDEGLIEPVA